MTMTTTRLPKQASGITFASPFHGMCEKKIAILHSSSGSGSGISHSVVDFTAEGMDQMPQEIITKSGIKYVYGGVSDGQAHYHEAGVTA